MEQEIHLGDIGTVFRVTLMDGSTAVDLTGITTAEFIFKKPDKTTTTVTATVDSPAAGILSYTTPDANFLDQTGRWKLQVSIVIPAWTGKSDLGEFLVYPNL